MSAAGIPNFPVVTVDLRADGSAHLNVVYIGELSFIVQIEARHGLAGAS